MGKNGFDADGEDFISNKPITFNVEAKDTRVKIDIVELNKEVAITVKKIEQLRADIDNILKEIEA